MTCDDKSLENESHYVIIDCHVLPEHDRRLDGIYALAEKVILCAGESSREPTS